MAQTILIVDDEPDIIVFLKDALLDEGYDVHVARDGPSAFARLAVDPDLIILDVMMPGLDGFTLCQAIRDRVSCPILFLSARQAETDRIQGLLVGGDDYLVKPIGAEELKARVNAHLRRERRRVPVESRRPILFDQDVVMDIGRYEMRVGDRPVPLTRTEFEIVQLLLSRPKQVFSREHIYDRVWGLDGQGDARTVTEHMKRIRGKLAQIDPDRTFIATVWGVGYKWESSP